MTASRLRLGATAKPSARRARARGPGSAPSVIARARVSQVARIVGRLERAILAGRFRPGERLGEIALAHWLGASRTPVREAVRELVARGLLVSHHGRGVSVRRFNANQISDVLDVRSCLECFALRLAIPRMVDRDVERLRVAFAAMEKARGADDMAAFETHDEAFHRAIVESAGNLALRSVIEVIEKQIRVMRLALLALPGEVEKSQDFHAALLDAIVRADSASAVALREQALEIDKRKLLARIENGKRSSLASEKRQQRPRPAESDRDEA